MVDYQRLAQDLVLAYNTQDEPALQRLNGHYRRAFTFDDLAAEIWRRMYTFPPAVVTGAEELPSAGRGAGAGRAGCRVRRLRAALADAAELRSATAAGLRRRRNRTTPLLPVVS